MSNPQKAKGTRFESAVRDYLQEHGHPDAIRPAQTGRLDVGDIHVGPFVLQAKDFANVVEGLRLGTNGAEAQRVVAGKPYAAAVLKRARRPIADAHVVIPLHRFAELLTALRAP